MATIITLGGDFLESEIEIYCKRELETVCSAIAYYRKKRGFTQSKLAALTGVSRQHIGAIESLSMNRPFSMELFIKICYILDMPPFEFFTISGA